MDPELRKLELIRNMNLQSTNFNLFWRYHISPDGRDDIDLTPNDRSGTINDDGMDFIYRR